MSSRTKDDTKWTWSLFLIAFLWTWPKASFWLLSQKKIIYLRVLNKSFKNKQTSTLWWSWHFVPLVKCHQSVSKNFGGQSKSTPERFTAMQTLQKKKFMKLLKDLVVLLFSPILLPSYFMTNSPGKLSHFAPQIDGVATDKAPSFRLN